MPRNAKMTIFGNPLVEKMLTSAKTKIMKNNMWGMTNKKIDNSNFHDFWSDWKVGMCLPPSYEESGS